ncbi:hypothetical protein EIP91_007643 [Steccherinum ochraceum]|uniref:AB hydrolase-1 domain-containing protein n=1 Tax=Steccherinum ochraceum TaxID=92696 RepID=A0A4R0RC84_9APHY|nr:hypothetical protein EIP91_007643 [Steccherinum ochraceum]
MAASSSRIVTKVLQSADGTPIYAEAVGDASKPSVVLVHGFAVSSIAFDGIFGEGDEGRDSWLDEVYLVRYDTRGHGRSGKPADPASWESRRLAEDFDAVVKGFGMSRPFVACWSLGGLTITDILSNNSPDYLSGAILLAGYPSSTAVYKLAAPPALAMIPPFRNTTSIETLQATAQDFLAAFTAPGSTPLPFILQQALLGNVLSLPRGCMEHILMRTQDETHLWNAGKSGLPMLAVNGTEDPLVDGAASAKMLQSEWKDITIHSVKGAGHMPFWEKPAEVREIMLSFVRRVVRSNTSPL